MNKAHLAYLKKAVNIAVNLNGIADVPSQINLLKSFRPPIYALIRDIASDPRFYSVTESTPFWHRYALASLQEFIESVPAATWRNAILLEQEKETFLNTWYCLNAMPLTASREKEIEQSLIAKGFSRPESPGEGSRPWGSIAAHGTVRDFTDATDGIAYGFLEDLPEEMQTYIRTGPPAAGGGEAEPHRAEAIYLSRIDRSLVRLAKMIGRHGGESNRPSTGKFQHSRRSDISGVAVGNDLNALLPAELALLGIRATENLFFSRYARKRLQIFSSDSTSESRPRQKKGAIIMCVDTSGSMTGEPESMAKSLALAVAIIAQKTRRPLCVVNYSHAVSFFLLWNLERQRHRFLKFLSLSYGGGNNENLLFDFLFRELPANDKYRAMKQAFCGADLLLISDFSWAPLSDASLALVAEARARDMKIYALGVDFSDRFCAMEHDPTPPDEEYFLMDDGYRFFDKCDYKFLYSHGRVTEYHQPSKQAERRCH